MSKNGPMHEEDAQEVSFQILEGLSYMHREGFAHRDIKPGNMLIRSQPPKSKWWVKISDFGISKRIEGPNAQSTVSGTIQYMAPELLWYEPGNPINYMAADIWALGVMVYRMLTLMPIFPTPNAYHYYLVNVDSFLLEELRKRGASSDAVLFIRSLMGPRPGERLASDKAMEHAWVASLKSHSTQIPTSPAPTPSNICSAGKQSASTSNLNPWATISTSSAEFSIEFPQPRVTFPISGKTTKGSLPAPSVDFVHTQFPAIHDSFQHKAAHYEPALQRCVEPQNITDADGPSAGENEDNSRVYSTEYVDKADPQTPIPPKSKVKEDTEQGLGWFKSHIITSFSYNSSN
ncbi:protein kinase-like protein [Trichoderma asperelloides]|nr:protein kinase-like protein [Trichoderma asperelloides]